MSKARPATYGKVDKLLHWLIAFNMGATLIFSPGMASLSDELKAVQYGDHAMSVTSIFILMTIRLIWRLSHPAPALPDTMKLWEKLLAAVTHKALYALIFFQIGVGILLASTTRVPFRAEGFGIDYSSFGLAGAECHGTLLFLHDAGAWSIGGLIVLHISAALKHHFWDKDTVLKRMLPFVRV